MKILKGMINFFTGSTKDLPSKGSNSVPKDAEESQRWHNERMGALLADDNSCVVKGLEYCATLQLRTPLRILSLDGTVWRNGVPPESEEPWHGIWVPQTKSWKELGIDFDEMPEGSSSSDIGYVQHSEYLTFLKDIRKVVETDESIKSRIESLLAVMREKKYAKYVKRHQGQNHIIDFYFPPVLDSIPGVNKTVSSALREPKITTVRQLRNKSDKELLAIKGVGPTALQKIREFTDNYHGDDTLDRTDAVER